MTSSLGRGTLDESLAASMPASSILDRAAQSSREGSALPVVRSPALLRERARTHRA
eukprot:CAMPEP_0175534230 /NCGR_PEP_ID=MMETSP0096-20121207/23585_1 /TAXON_ID=311494 /ORGANISM="Alexandrium monilatum, Strain CCMP3105" /LENGTH=55 /DNA_ID=CAMNT_0016837007 /DNA_START=13 /DNA_END=177 /DNA_ORIENTATION=-